MNTASEITETEEKSLVGIRGWLILIAIGIVVSPLRILVLVIPLYADIFKNGAWELLTTPGNELYHPLWSPIIMGEIAINAIFIVGWIVIAFFFFLKKRVFPKLYIGMLLFTLSFIVLDAYAIKAVLPDDPVFDPDTLKELIRTLGASLIWIPYMLISKRVRATFVN
jgi:hypothetical protein